MVKISDLFEVKRGSCTAIDAYESGVTPLVSASTYNQGVVGFVSAPDEQVFPSGSISVAVIGDGSSCFACLQVRPFHASINTEVLIPKRPLEVVELVAIAAIIRASKWRFHYGRIVGGRLKSLELDEALIDRIACQVTGEAPKPMALEAGVLHRVVAHLRELCGDHPTVGDVFELKQNKPFGMVLVHETGAIPVTSATEKEVNSIVGYVNESSDELMPANSISVTKDGKPGVARVQPRAWLSASNSVCLNPRVRWDIAELTVLAALIERQVWRFGYGRKASDERLSDLRLLDGFTSPSL